MKTKFSAIVNLRKKNMQKCEYEMIQNENHIATKQSEVNELNNEFLAMESPSHGTFSSFMAFENSKKIFSLYINQAKKELESLIARKVALQEQYKQLNIEYEKVKFLEQKEQNALIKKLKAEEKAALDEVALMLYNNGGKAI